MAVEGILLERAREAQASVLVQRTQQSPRAASETADSASTKFPLSSETPRASSASTPSSSIPSSAKSTPSKPKKYVSQMAKAREEKKRQAAAAAARHNNNGDKSTSSSDMETSSASETSVSDMSSKKSVQEDKLGNLPKFGEWEKHSVNSGPCYTLLFQKAAQEKKIGGPVPVHGPRPSDSAGPNGDLYGCRPPVSTPMKDKNKKKQHGLLCCFKASEVS